MYPVFVIGIYCKGCVIVRESVKTQVPIEVKVDFVRSFARSLPTK